MNNIVSFFGADHKCGTSMIAQSAAEIISGENPDKKVLLAHAENGTGTFYSPMVCESLENIRPYLSERIIDSDELSERCRYKNNLFIIGGADKPAAADLFSTDMGQYFMEIVSEKFDYVICDAGSNIDDGIAFGALCSSGRINVVTTQNEFSVRRFEWMKSLLNKLGFILDNVIINRYRSDAVNNIDLIAERFGVEKTKLITVADSRFGEYAEQDERTILNYRDRKYEREIRKIVKHITG